MPRLSCEFPPELFQHLRRNIDARCVQMLCGLGQMSLALAGTPRRHPTMRILTMLSLRIAALMLPHFASMIF